MTALLERVAATEPERDLHYGIEVLRLHVDDPIPTPRAPKRYAVKVSPDLARYLLTFNHPNNRNKKPSAIAKYRRDMEQGYWPFTPESIVFSLTPELEDGQNRLHAVIESGKTVWLMVDFGWPANLISVINRGSSRTNADSFAANGAKNAMSIAAAIVVADKYAATVGTHSSWSARLLTSSEALERYVADSENWDASAVWGRRVYEATMGLGPTTWTAAHYIIAGTAGTAKADAFFNELHDGSGAPGSATRRLGSHYLRRKANDTASGDRREPMENIIRAFNAWQAGKPVGFIRTGGAFTLSAVKKG